MLQMSEAEEQGVEIMVFPEFCITGYSCQDLFREQLLIEKAENGLMHLLDYSRQLDIIAIVGLPIIVNGLLYNCAAVIQRGTVLGVVAKTYLPNYGEFYEKRWFASAQDLNPSEIYLAGSRICVSAEPQVFVTPQGVKFGVEICEDVWAPIPPSNNLALAGADIIFNLSASDELAGKHQYVAMSMRAAALGSLLRMWCLAAMQSSTRMVCCCLRQSVSLSNRRCASIRLISNGYALNAVLIRPLLMHNATHRHVR